MPEPLIHYAFSAGELSPTLKARSDLEKYDLGLELCENFFVDYRGGVSTRPGLEFISYVMDDDKATKFVEFRFSPDIANTYLLLFGDLYLRFIQDGAYVLEADVTISGITQATPCTITALAHGFSDGDWVIVSAVVGMTEINGRTLIVINKTTDTFEVQDPFAVNLNSISFSVYSSAGVVNRIYTVTTTYVAADLARLRAHQVRDVVTLTHNDYDRRILTRVTATNWTLAVESAASPLSAPTGVTVDPETSATSGVGYTVTALDEDGKESLPARTVLNELATNITVTADSVKITWTAVTGAKSYNIYRTLFTRVGADITLGDDLGFIGRTFGTQFLDNNIIPDFTKAPPLYINPFADAAITAIDVTAQGTSHTKASTVSVSGSPGSGFAGYPIVNDGGNLLAVVITNAGSGYVSPTVSFSDGNGTATATAGEATGNDPAVSIVFEQRKIYGGTTNFPMSLNGSKPDDFDNFDISGVADPSDAFAFTLDDEEVAPIRHMLPIQDGLLVASKSGAWLLHGIDGAPITAVEAKADQLIFSGISNLVPLRIDTDILYAQEGGAIIKGLVFNQFARALKPEDLSTLSNHLFEKYEVENWAHAEDPFKLIWAQRADGVLLAFTYVRDQKVFAWTQHKTKGLILDVKVVREGAEYIVYLMVKRRINGRWSKFVEKMAARTFGHVEDAWAVDSGLQLDQPTPSASLVVAAATGASVNFTAGSGVFVSGDVGKVIRAGGGKAVITAFTSTTVVVCRIERDLTDVLFQDATNMPLEIDSGDWTMTEPVTTVTGLHHLEGETVKVYADGNVVPDLTVSDGSVTLVTAASKIIIGLGFTCKGKTLPATSTSSIVEGRRKRIVGLAVRVYNTRGLRVGADFDSLYEMKDRTVEEWGDPTDVQSKSRTVIIEASFDEDGSIVFQQDYPLPATVLGFVLDADIGDDSARSDM